MATIYVDLTSGNDSTGTGTHNAPYKTKGKANSGRSTSDLVLVKCGGVDAERFSPTWGGSSGNHAVLGAYYLDGGSPVRGVSGSKPQLRGGNLPFYGMWQAGGTPTVGDRVVRNRAGANANIYIADVVSGAFSGTQGTWTTTVGASTVNGGVTLRCLGTIPNNYNYTGLINNFSGVSYFTFENLNLTNYWGNGITLDYSSGSTSNFTVTDVDMSYLGMATYYLVKTLTNVTITGGDHWLCGLSAPGAGYNPANGGNTGYVTIGQGADAVISTKSIEISGAIFRNCAREAVLHHGGPGTPIKFHDNILFNVYHGPYLIGGQYNQVYNNIIVGGPDTNFHWWPYAHCGPAISISTEGSGAGLGGNRINNDNHDVYNNMVAFHKDVIHMGDSSAVTGGITYYSGRNCNIVHNTGVDCLYAMACWGNSYTGTAIKNNLFARYTAGTMLYSFGASVGSKSNNLWPTAPPSGLSGTGDVITTSPGLTKTSGWQGATAYTSITSADFVPTESSPAVGAGTYLAAFATDALGNSRTARTDIGALQFAASADVTAPTTPGTPGSFTNVTQTGMDFSWTASTDAVGVTLYTIYLDGNYFDTSVTNSYSATGLVANTSHSWTVTASDAAGNVSAASSAGVQSTSSPTDTTAPTFGGATSASVDSATGRVTVSWTQATDDTTAQAQIRYRVYHATSTGTHTYNGAGVDILVTGIASVEIGWHYPGIHYFVVRALDLAGNEDTNTVEVSVVVPQLAPIAARPRIRMRA